MRKKMMRQRSKAIMALIMTAAMAMGGLTGCGGKTPAAPETTAAAAAETTLAPGADSDWYMKALDDAAMKEQYPYHCFVDVNGNGVPVLFLSSTEKSFIGAEDKACMIVYDAGSPKTVKEIGKAGGEKFFCDTDAHTVTWYHRLSGESHIEVYQLKDGSLETITTADSYSPHHYPGKDNQEQLFFQDGKEVSEEENKALWEKYANEKDEISYTK